MASPGGEIPGGSIVVGGFEAWRARSEASAKSAMTGAVLGAYIDLEDEVDVQIKIPRDEQAELINSLINDVSLLEGVPAYGAVYQSFNIWIINNNPILPFNSKIGPAKLVDVLGAAGSTTTGGLRGYDPGLWNITVQTYADSTPYTGNPWVALDLYVLVYDSSNTEIMGYQTLTVEYAADGETSLATNFSFVIPSSVDHFDCYVRCRSARWRRISGGTRFSIMSLRRISVDVANTSTSPTVPDGNAAPS